MFLYHFLIIFHVFFSLTPYFGLEVRRLSSSIVQKEGRQAFSFGLFFCIIFCKLAIVLSCRSHLGPSAPRDCLVLMILPSFMTRIKSALRIVDKRWAMTRKFCLPSNGPMAFGSIPLYVCRLRIFASSNQVVHP